MLDKTQKGEFSFFFFRFLAIFNLRKGFDHEGENDVRKTFPKSTQEKVKATTPNC